ncbi:MAG: PAS domain-containing protein [Williamsia sp.]|nr:PAS domain-containing protein [Williamsia sp.]
MENKSPLVESLMAEMEELRRQLYEANETIEAIRTGQVDALVVQNESGHQLYTLRTADQTYRVFIETMTEGAVTLNQQGIILYANSQFALMISKPLTEIIGAPIKAFIEPATYAVYESLFHSCRVSGECRGEIELSTGGKPRPVQLSFTARDLEEGVSHSLIVTDLSGQKAVQKELALNNRELEQMNEKLEASNHDLQQFASIASHDLQEPLRKIQLFANLLRDRDSDGTGEKPAKPQLDKIINAAARMRALIIDVLNYSKLSAKDGHFVLTDLNKLIREISEDFELITQEKEARFSIGQLPLLEANPGQLRQVFQNLISNSLKFSRPGIPPLIQITASNIREKKFDSDELAYGDFCLLRIKDNGIGFDEKYTENIFALFERLHSKDAYEGTGIGLAITKKIVEKHGGLITARSKVNEGAEFQLILPLRQTP